MAKYKENSMQSIVELTTYPLQISEGRQETLKHTRSESTKAAYRQDLWDFEAWCDKHGFHSLPAHPNTVAEYLDARKNTLSPATLSRRVAGISQAHKMAGLQSPCQHEEVRSTMKGICRMKTTAQDQKHAIETHVLRQMVAEQPDTVAGIRNRALLLLGFAGAFRRSELVSLDCEDIQRTVDGMRVTLRHSKTDQEGSGTEKGIPFGRSALTCPVRTLEDWLNVSGIKEGAIFRAVTQTGKVSSTRMCDRSVALIIKQAAESVGLNPDDYSGHSLRSGLATSAAAAGKSERSIMNQTGHKSLTVLRRYIRQGSLFRDNAADGIGL